MGDALKLVPSSSEVVADGVELEQKERRVDCLRSTGVAVAMVIVSVILALVLRDYGTETLPKDLRFPSGLLGWVYFSAWSISFWPQTLQNFARRSTVGMSFDYQIYNVVGFTAYSIYNCAFFFVPSVQDAYRAAHNGNSNQVQINDVLFALHAIVLTLVIVVQMAVLESGGQRVSVFAMVVCGGSVLVLAVFAVLVAAEVDGGGLFTWLNWLYAVSYAKLGVTLIKYFPQAISNHRRGTTDGFSMHNVVLDFTGGSLSVAQLVLDSWATNDWSAVTGDLVKFLLGLTSMVFDVVFVMQHYCCFATRNSELLRRRLVLQRQHGAAKASQILADEERLSQMDSSRSVYGSVATDSDMLLPASPLKAGALSTGTDVVLDSTV